MAILPVVIAAMGGAVVFWQVSRLTEAQDRVSRSQAALEAAEFFIKLQIDMETGLHGWVITGQRNFLTPLSAAQSVIGRAFIRLQGLVIDDPVQLGTLGKIRALHSGWSDSVAGEIAKNDREASANADVRDKARKQVEAIRAEVDALMDREREKLESYRLASDASRQAAYWMAGIVAAVTGLGIAVLVFTGFSRAARSYDAALTEATEQRRAVAAINENLEELVHVRTGQLEQARDEHEAFAYAIAHELRGRLRSLSGFSQVLLEEVGPKVSGEALDASERIRDANREMSETIEALLSLAKLSRSQVNLAPVDVSAIAEGALTELRQTDPERTVDAVIEPGIVVSGDHELLSMAIKNLIHNAWKFTSSRPDARIELKAEPRDDGLEVSVADNGVGFSSESGDKLFKPFERLHGRRDFAGTGIGLAIVHKVMSLHDGNAKAQGAEGEGATFTLWFPNSDGRVT